MRTVCNMGGGGGLKIGKNAYVINGRPLRDIIKPIPAPSGKQRENRPVGVSM